MSGIRGGRTAGAAFAAVMLVTTLGGCAGGGGPDPVGTWGDPDGAYLELESGGAFTGNDGCNRLTGSWTMEDDNISFDDVASTRMACPETEAVLEGLDTANVSGDTMTVYADDEAQIATLDRAPVNS
ncbi:META domain-containing protein [Agromyces sp. NBRC 114283]|uniref:META domain-containing protein n=1 Tax=Agromyces sp. NBRC 114283 TaxID=2994521 RepID=UPI0024A1463D|nr:META domain-containing protein [Agromyces sp. NBRC 114283]GLU88592.1 hypothetical protein Agsp01_08470 [Agromyces sp. NBRC 114283]